MADALCGPSNALQDFKRHAQTDRSLQQDRFTGPQTSRSSFRTRDPRTGTLDADFHAFENASANPFQEQLIGNLHTVQPRFQQPAPSWASDFQQLRISDQPLPAQQFRNYAPLVTTTNGGWQNEFMRQQPNEQSLVAQGKQVAPSYAPQFHYQNSFAPMSLGGTAELQQGHDVAQTQVPDQFAGADWSQAFEEAFQDAFKHDEQVQQPVIAQETTASQQVEEQTMSQSDTVQETEQIRIGSDAIDYTEMKDRTVDQEQQDANALARVAGELLHHVQHDSSQKFQNSQFLDLMRKIRDRQVEVRNNDFEATTVGGDSETLLQSDRNFLPLSDQAVRHAADPTQDQKTFAFPNMNTVYAPHEGDFVDYSFDSDQFPVQPRTQISDLHPGGKYYPEQSPTTSAVQMSGAVSENTSGTGNDSKSNVPLQGIPAADLESAYYGTLGPTSQYQRTAA